MHVGRQGALPQLLNLSMNSTQKAQVLCALAALALVGVSRRLLAVNTTNQQGGAGCTPVPVHDITAGSASTTGNGSSNTTFTPQTNNYVWQAGSADHGYYVHCTAAVGCTATADTFIWAEDGDHIGVDFSAKAGRSHSFKTNCVPKPKHNTPPVGDTTHDVTATAKALYRASSPADAGARSASVTLIAQLPTGKDLKVNYQLVDGSATTHTRTVGFTATGTVGSTTTTRVSGNSGSDAVQGSVTQANSVGASGTINYTHTATWTTNASSSDADILTVNDRKVFRPKCHGAADLGDELAEIQGTMNLTANNYWVGDPVGYIKGKFEVATKVINQRNPRATCGVLGQTPPSTGGGQTPPSTGGGSPQPSHPVTPRPTSTGDGQTRATGRGGKGTTAPVTPRRPRAKFQVTVGEEEQYRKFYSRIPDASASLITFAGLGAATRNDLQSAPETLEFDPFGAVILTTGSWLVELPVDVHGVGYAIVDLALDESFSETASAVLELVSEPFSAAAWELGVHSGHTPFSRDVLAFGPEASVLIESLVGEVEALGQPSVSWSSSGDDVEWLSEPFMEFDAVAHQWHARVPLASSANFDLHISFGHHHLTVPVNFIKTH